jgi:hypothetical protein
MYISTARRIVLLLRRLRLLHDERGVSVTGSQASKIVLLHYAPWIVLWTQWSDWMKPYNCTFTCPPPVYFWMQWSGWMEPYTDYLQAGCSTVAPPRD